MNKQSSLYQKAWEQFSAHKNPGKELALRVAGLCYGAPLKKDQSRTVNSGDALPIRHAKQ